VRLEGLGELKNSTSSALEPATFRLVAWSLNHLRYQYNNFNISAFVLPAAQFL
jgi:hypothetical protein